uniref:Putative reverse transcriptase domain-containing protein n=1 Tax=Tanacetum cinerariifolium TaxID=118510 RepID=A0A6L2KML9_TANCI|nr:putative reverse transcriptase domain-containing protein [Tanacetum cinerariifolium]
MGANGGVEGVNGNVEGANRRAHDFSMIIAQQLKNLLPVRLAQVGNQGNVRNQNGNVVHENVQENVGNMLVNGNRVGCSYKEFLACNPKEYDCMGGDVVLTRWIEKMKNVQDMSGCSVDQKVKYTTGLFNHAMVGAGHVAYTDRFLELVRLIPQFVTLESRKIKRNGSIKKVRKRGNMGEPSKDKKYGGTCIEPSELGFRYEIEIASGQLVEIDKVINGYRLEIKGHVFDIDLIPFKYGSFDVIVGLDWLSNHKAEIISHKKVARIPLLDGKFLRHVINGHGIHVDPSKIEAVKNWKAPRTMTEKCKTFDWGEEHELAFQTLKDKLCNAPILAPPNGPEDFVIYYDASGIGLGCVLMQRDKDTSGSKEIVDEIARLQKGLNEMIEQRKGTLYYMDQIWEGIAIDFVNKLPRTSSRHDTIWVIVDRLTKFAHFLPIREDYKIDRLGRLYLNEIVSRHGVPISIKSNHDSRFVSRKCHLPIVWAEVGEGQLIGPELVQETSEKILQIKDKLKVVRDCHKSYADKRRKPLEFSAGDYILLKVSPWKGVVCFRKKGKLTPRFVGPFEIIEKVGHVAYRLDSPEELNGVHDTLHVSNLKKCLSDPTLQVPLDEIQVDAKLNFVEEPVEVLEREFKKLKRSRIAIVKDTSGSKEIVDEIARLQKGLNEMIEQRKGTLYYMDQIWEGIAIDFVNKLPRTSSRHDTIWVIVDRLTKFAHFLPIREDYKIDRLGRLYLNEIVSRHGVPISIKSNHDSRFVSSKCHLPIVWAEVGEGQLIGPELVQETSEKILQIKDKLKVVRDCHKSYADKRRKPLEFSAGDYILLKVSPWKGVVCFRKKGKLTPRFVGPFEIIEKVGHVAYRLDSPEELNGVHDTLHVSNLKKCLSDPTLQVPLDEIQVDAKLNFVEEPVEVLEREFKKLKRSRIAIVKVQKNLKCGLEFMWEREDRMKLKYPHLFSDISG